MGRIDNQVKIRGFRIELGEIETVLARHPAVQDCVVIAREDVAGDKRLVGYVVPAAGQKVNAAELRNWVKERLPEYMVPVAWVEMASLPLSPNGKVDRKNLPAPDYERPELAGEYQGARTPTEEVMAGIWAEVLRLDQVGVKDDFFELGRTLAAGDTSGFAHPACVPGGAAACAHCSKLRRWRDWRSGWNACSASSTDCWLRRSCSVPRNQRLPLSFAQQRLWFLDQLEPNNPLYNIPRAIAPEGRVECGGVGAGAQRHRRAPRDLAHDLWFRTGAALPGHCL